MLPVIFPTMLELKVLTPAIVWSPVSLTAVASLTVILELPSKLTPLILIGVYSLVAVAELPVAIFVSNSFFIFVELHVVSTPITVSIILSKPSSPFLTVNVSVSKLS